MPSILNSYPPKEKKPETPQLPSGSKQGKTWGKIHTLIIHQGRTPLKKKCRVRPSWNPRYPSSRIAPFTIFTSPCLLHRWLGNRRMNTSELPPQPLHQDLKHTISTLYLMDAPRSYLYGSPTLSIVVPPPNLPPMWSSPSPLLSGDISRPKWWHCLKPPYLSQCSRGTPRWRYHGSWRIQLR